MKRYNFYFLLVSFAVVTIVYSCKESEIPLESGNSFDLIQDQLLTTNCAVSGCHSSESDPAFLQHGLILTKGKSYDNLFSKIPKNVTAIEEKLQLITPFDSKNSLFYQKLLFENSHKSNKTFGSIMPLGGDMLFKGQIEYVKRWIDAGAPKTGNVVDVALLNDKTLVLAKFEPLPIPIANEGFQMRIEPFEIFPNFEREIFINKPLNNKEAVYINKFQIKMHPGSHHFILYGFRNPNTQPKLNEMRDLRYKDQSFNLKTFTELANHVFYFGGSESNFTFNFPAGTAVELPPNMNFDMNSHFFNKSSKSYNGEVNINLYTLAKEKVKNTLKIIDFGNTSFTLPPKQKTTAIQTFKFSKNTKIVTLFSHTHKLGEKFEILINGGARNGEIIYTSTNWEHPNKIDFAVPISLKAGEGLTSRITYNNFTDKSVRFGFTSDDEMGIIFGYYYEE